MSPPTLNCCESGMYCKSPSWSAFSVAFTPCPLLLFNVVDVNNILCPVSETFSDLTSIRSAFVASDAVPVRLPENVPVRVVPLNVKFPLSSN